MSEDQKKLLAAIGRPLPERRRRRQAAPAPEPEQKEPEPEQRTPTPPPPPAPKPCDKNWQSRNDAGNCVDTKPCPDGKPRDDAGNCPCPDGQRRFDDGNCYTERCEDGQQRNPDGSCPDPIPQSSEEEEEECPEGTTKDDDGNCVGKFQQPCKKGMYHWFADTGMDRTKRMMHMKETDFHKMQKDFTDCEKKRQIASKVGMNALKNCRSKLANLKRALMVIYKSEAALKKQLAECTKGWENTKKELEKCREEKKKLEDQIQSLYRDLMRIHDELHGVKWTTITNEDGTINQIRHEESTGIKLSTDTINHSPGRQNEIMAEIARLLEKGSKLPGAQAKIRNLEEEFTALAKAAQDNLALNENITFTERTELDPIVHKDPILKEHWDKLVADDITEEVEDEDLSDEDEMVAEIEVDAEDEAAMLQVVVPHLGKGFVHEKELEYLKTCCAKVKDLQDELSEYKIEYEELFNAGPIHINLAFMNRIYMLLYGTENPDVKPEAEDLLKDMDDKMTKLNELMKKFAEGWQLRLVNVMTKKKDGDAKDAANALVDDIIDKLASYRPDEGMPFPKMAVEDLEDATSAVLALEDKDADPDPSIDKLLKLQQAIQQVINDNIETGKVGDAEPMEPPVAHDKEDGKANLNMIAEKLAELMAVKCTHSTCTDAECDELKITVQALKNKLENKNKNLDEVYREYWTGLIKLGEATLKSKDGDDDKLALSQENAALEKEANAVPKSDDTAHYQPMTDKLLEQVAECEKLPEHACEDPGPCDECARLRAELVALQERYNELEAKYDALNTKISKIAKKHSDVPESGVNYYEEKEPETNTNANLDSMDAALGNLVDQVKMLVAEKEAMVKDLDAAATEMEAEGHQVGEPFDRAHYDKDIAAIKTLVATLREQIAKLEADLEKARDSSCGEGESCYNDDEITKLRQRIQDLIAANAALTKKLEETEAKLSQCTADLEKCTAELAALKLELAAVQKALELMTLDRDEWKAKCEDPNSDCAHPTPVGPQCPDGHKCYDPATHKPVPLNAKECPDGHKCYDPATHKPVPLNAKECPDGHKCYDPATEKKVPKNSVICIPPSQCLTPGEVDDLKRKAGKAALDGHICPPQAAPAGCKPGEVCISKSELDRLRSEAGSSSSSASSEPSVDVNLMNMIKNRESLLQIINLIYRKHDVDKMSNAQLQVMDIYGLLNHLKSIWNRVGNRTIMSKTIPWHSTSPWLRGVICWVNEKEIRQLPEFKSDAQYRALADMTHPHTAAKLALFARKAGII